MQIIENWAEIEGKVNSIEPHPSLRGYSIAKVTVSSSKDVAGFRNLFSPSNNQEIAINVPAVKVGPQLHSGSLIHWKVRKAAPTVAFVDPEAMRQHS